MKISADINKGKTHMFVWVGNISITKRRVNNTVSWGKSIIGWAPMSKDEGLEDSVEEAAKFSTELATAVSIARKLDENPDHIEFYMGLTDMRDVDAGV